MAKYQDWLEPDKLIRLEGWARDGLIDEQIAKNMGVSYSTLREWKVKYAAFSAALKKGKEVVDFEIENELLKKARGYTYVEETKENVGGEMVVTKRVTKHVTGDVTAQIFWLKNRKPEWRRANIDPSASNTDEKLDKLLAAMDKELGV